MSRRPDQVGYDDQVLAALHELGRATPTTLTLHVPRQRGAITMPADYGEIRMSLGRLLELGLVRHSVLDYFPTLAAVDMQAYEQRVR